MADEEPAPHIVRFVDALVDADAKADACSRSLCIEEVADALCVLPSTAWGYLCAAVCIDDGAQHIAAKRFIYPPLMRALLHVDSSGSLTEVMRRLEASSDLSGDPVWRCEVDRYAQLRCARLCIL